MNRRLIIGTVAALSAALIATLAYPSKQPAKQETARVDVTKLEYFYAAVRAQTELDKFIPDKSVLLFGDSIMNSVDSAAIPNAVNLSISGNLTAGIVKQMMQMSAVKRASAIVLQGGINDMVNNGDGEIVDGYATMLRLAKTPVFLVGVPPVRDAELNDRVTAITAKLKALCQKTERCHFIDTSSLRGDVFRDHVHPNEAGIAILTKLIAQALATT